MLLIVHISPVQLTALFEMSGLRDVLGVTIRTCNILDIGVDITFTVDLFSNTTVTLQEVEMAFKDELIGKDSNIVSPDSVLLFDTLFVGEPSKSMFQFEVL